MRSLLSFAAAVLVAGSCYAAPLGAGTQELVVSGLLDPSGFDGMEVLLDLSYGVFVVDSIEAGGGVGYVDVGVATSWSFFGFGEYNFNIDDKMVPFAGARLGWAWSEVDTGLDKEDQSAIVIGGYCGAKYFLSPSVAVSGQINLDLATDEIYVNDDDLDSFNMTITVGMRFFLPAGTIKSPVQ